MSCTFDSNLLIYASGAGKADPRVDRARDIIARAMLGGTALLTLQALGEFSNAAMRRYRLAIANVRVMTEDWSRAIPVFAADETDLAFALATVSRHRLRFWDAMLWATARRVGVRYLLTEDLQDGRSLEGVTFVNPFNPSERRADRAHPAGLRLRAP